MADIRVDGDKLRDFTAAVFEQVGLTPEDAAIEAEVLVWANLRGVDSHGVQRVNGYVHAVEAGHYNTRPDIRIERETPATMLIEADCAFGPVVTTYAMKQAIEKARGAGIGWVLIRNTTHQGAMAYYAQMAARENMAGIASVCNPPNMAPPGARAPGVHNSPIAIAVPGSNGRTISLDMATSVAAFGKLDVAVDRGESIPDTWALDGDGTSDDGSPQGPVPAARGRIQRLWTGPHLRVPVEPDGRQSPVDGRYLGRRRKARRAEQLHRRHRYRGVHRSGHIPHADR